MRKKKDLWALMCPTPDELLAEALTMSDEDVAERLQAKGYDLTNLDAELLGLVAKLPPQKRRSRRGFAAVSALAVVAVLGLLNGFFADAPLRPPTPTGAAPPAQQDSASNDAGWESVTGTPRTRDRLNATESEERNGATWQRKRR